MKTREDVALLVIDKNDLVPTEVGRKNPFVIGEEVRPVDFDFGSPVSLSRQERVSDYKNIYRHFKADLSLTKTALTTLGGTSWQMKTKATDRDKHHGGKFEIIAQDGRNKSYFNPLEASYVFLWNICKYAVNKVEEFIGSNQDIKIHFTAPSYEDQDTDKSQRYRDNIREVVYRISNSNLAKNVTFTVGKSEFLYEAYAVYYYYAFIQNSVGLGKNEAEKTYLIFDMGGSTTDLGIVQINRKGNVSHVYPICDVIDCAGSYFDQFILKKLINAKQRPRESAKWNPVLEEIEQAKIDLCEGTASSVKVVIEDETHVLTKELIENILVELWQDTSRPLGPGFRGFIETARARAKQNSQFLEFDKIERVFLAGGSTGLPGLRTLIRGALEKFDLVNGEDIFEEPTLASSSSVAALGRAAELANTADPLLLDRARHVYAKLVDDSEQNFVFRNIDGTDESMSDEEMLLFGVRDLEARAQDEDGWVAFEKNEQGRSLYQLVTLQEGTELPSQLDIYLRTDISEYDEKPQFSEESEDGLSESINTADYKWLEFSCKAQHAQEAVKVRPFVFVDSKPNGRRRRLHREIGSESISLKPDQVDGDVHICIDLGMNNTAVAVCTPGRNIPEGLDDFRVLRSRHSGPEQDTPEESGRDWASEEKDLIGDSTDNGQSPDSVGGLPTEPNGPDKANATGSKGVLTSSIWLSPEALSEVEQIIDRMVSPMIKSVNRMIDVTEEVTKANVELSAELKKLSSEIRERSEETAKVRFANPAEEVVYAVAENRHSLAQPKSEANSFGEFVRFINEREKRLHYSEEVLRTVWTLCQNDSNRLVILAGPPGSGKSSLVGLLAEFFNHDVGNDWEYFYLLQPVSPTWFSSASLLGNYSEIDGQYHGTDFLRLLISAQEHWEEVTQSGELPRYFFACLDEFNLAHPEQYMADLLSTMEAPHDSKAREITLCRKDLVGWNDDLTIRLPPNVKLFATINTDVSTKTLSPKVLDRSMFVRLTPKISDLKKVAEQIADRCGADDFHEALISESSRGGNSILDELFAISIEGQVPIGYRTLEQAFDYAVVHPRRTKDITNVLEDVICNLFLPKLPGSHAVADPVQYRELLSADKSPRLRKLSRVAQTMDHIQRGLPGQAAL